jgi:hypothetical protein
MIEEYTTFSTLIFIYCMKSDKYTFTAPFDSTKFMYQASEIATLLMAFLIYKKLQTRSELVLPASGICYVHGNYDYFPHKCNGRIQ